MCFGLNFLIYEMGYTLGDLETCEASDLALDRCFLSQGVAKAT